MNSIKPCRCGGVAFIDYFSQNAPMICCKKCDNEYLFRRGDNEHAAKEWNKRQKEQPHDK